MYEKNFSNSLIELRIRKGVSARDMSLSIGQNPSYINNIETGKALPSMTNFFYICDYLEISPADFFEFDYARPVELARLGDDLSKLTESQFQNIKEIVSDLAKANK